MKEKVYFREFAGLLMRHKNSLCIIMIVSLFSFVQLSFILPKTYKTEFELTIYSKYFKNAIISEVIPGMSSMNEMTQTVDSMVKEVMSDQFIDEIGYKYKIYPQSLTPYELSKKRQLLRDQFQMYPSGGQAYRISFVNKDPLVTYEVSKIVMDKVRNYFILARLDTIEVAKKTIFKRLESANVSRQMQDSDVSSNALASKNHKVLKNEISKIDQDIAALRMQFNFNHPKIKSLEQRRSTILNWLNEDAPEASEAIEVTHYNDAPLLVNGDSETSRNITSKLFAKFNDINIALDIERKSVASYIGVLVAPQIPTSPLFPKKRLFASLGFLIGLMICFSYVFYKEIMTLNSMDKTKAMSNRLHTQFFGTLPHIDSMRLITNRPIYVSDDVETTINASELVKIKINPIAERAGEK